MARTCTFSWGARGGKAEWSFEGEGVLLVPEEGSPLSFALKECSGISGDGYAIDLAYSGQALSLQRLGQDGPTLLEHLWRLWPPLRASALRLSGSGEPKRFRGTLAAAEGPRPCEILVFEDLLVLAPEGADLQPVFSSLVQRVAFDESAYAVSLVSWEGHPVILGRLAGETQALLDAAKEARSRMAKEAADAAFAHLPGLGAGARAALASVWLPGRMLPIEELEGVCPGFAAAVDASWIGASPRKREAKVLLDWAGAGGTWIGHGRPGLGLGAGGAEETAEGEPREGGEQEDAPAEAEPPDRLLWLLCGKSGRWLLETLTEEGHATYRFEGRGEMPHLISRLLCAPQFSREALYKPLEALTGERSDLAVAARELGFLRELRARFRGRAIHAGMTRWRSEAGL